MQWVRFSCVGSEFSVPASLWYTVEVCNWCFLSFFILIFKKILKQHTIFLKSYDFLLIREEISSKLLFLFILSQSNMFIPLTVKCSFTPQFGLNQKSIIKVMFLVWLSQHSSNAFLDIYLFDGFSFILQVLIDSFSIS